MLVIDKQQYLHTKSIIKNMFLKGALYIMQYVIIYLIINILICISVSYTLAIRLNMTIDHKEDLITWGMICFITDAIHAVFEDFVKSFIQQFYIEKISIHGLQTLLNSFSKYQNYFLRKEVFDNSQVRLLLESYPMNCAEIILVCIRALINTSFLMYRIGQIDCKISQKITIVTITTVILIVSQQSMIYIKNRIHNAKYQLKTNISNLKKSYYVAFDSFADKSRANKLDTIKLIEIKKSIANQNIKLNCLLTIEWIALHVLTHFAYFLFRVFNFSAETNELMYTQYIVISTIGSLLTTTISNIMAISYHIVQLPNNNFELFNALDTLDKHVKHECEFKSCSNIHDITFDNIEYMYSQQSKQNLVGKNLILKHKKINLITGTSGSGKTSFLNVLADMIDHDNLEAIVYLTDNNKDKYKYMNYEIPQFFGQITEVLNSNSEIPSYVTKVPLIEFFECEIGDDKTIMQILCALRLHDCIKDLNIPVPYTLSSGQKQRVLVAKILYKASKSKANILILDEVDSKLDENTALHLASYISDQHQFGFLQNKVICIVSHIKACQEYYKKQYCNIIHVDNGIVSMII
jgi:energy-coupling factor transporter ATP-binding protein EcfA2